MLSVLITWIRTRAGLETGQDLIEYAMLGGLIALALLAASIAFAGPLASMATGIGECIDFNSATVCNPV
jgi:Flp pilus assembly pilin Flp